MGVPRLIAVITAFSLHGCSPIRRGTKETSGLASLDVTAAIDLQEVARYVTDILKDIPTEQIAKTLDSLPVTSYWQQLDTFDSKGTLVFKTRAIPLPEAEVIQARNARTKARRTYRQKDTTLKQYISDSGSWDPEEFNYAFLGLGAFVSADVDVGEHDGLSLAGPIQRVKEIRHLAETGLSIYNSPLKAVPVALDPETWKLIQRNRRVVGVSLDIATRLKPKHQKLNAIAKIVRGVMVASDFMTTYYEGREFLPKEQSILD